MAGVVVRQRKRIVFLGLLLFVGSGVAAQTSVDLGWNPSLSSDVTGYRVYQGVDSQDYTNVVDSGNVTFATISGLVAGTTYYFAVTAYNVAGLESPFSGEISYTVPVPPPSLQIQVTPDKVVTLTATGPAGYRYDLQASEDLTSWTTIANVTMDEGGWFQFADPQLATGPGRAYRLLQVYP